MTKVDLLHHCICDILGFVTRLYLRCQCICGIIGFMTILVLWYHSICYVVAFVTPLSSDLWHCWICDIIEMTMSQNLWLKWIFVVIRFVTYRIMMLFVTILDFRGAYLGIRTDWNQSGPNALNIYVISYTILSQANFSTRVWYLWETFEFAWVENLILLHFGCSREV